MENDDSLEFDEEEDSHEEDSDKDKELKETKDVNGKPPYSYVAMIGKYNEQIPIPNRSDVQRWQYERALTRN